MQQASLEINAGANVSLLLATQVLYICSSAAKMYLEGTVGLSTTFHPVLLPFEASHMQRRLQL